MAWGTKSYVTLGLRQKRVIGTRLKSYLTLGGTAILILVFLILVFLFWSLHYHIFSSSKPASSFKYALSSLTSQICKKPPPSEEQEHRIEIPNLVHYVWLLKDPSTFSLSFQHFISFYSAHVYFEPNIIYIHTDASPEVFTRAKNTGDKWTRRILALPSVQYNYVSAPSETTKGVKIQHMEHKADFLRMEVLYQHGGIYMDSDVTPLRQIADLRSSGFANIVGGAVALEMKHTGFINNGVMLAAPGTTMMDVYIQAAHEHFDGNWATASIYLLTDIANRLSIVPNEVLILQPNAFAPISWEVRDQERLFKPHGEGGIPERPVLFGTDLDSCREVFDWLEANENHEREEWEMDFSSSYVLHAFNDDNKRIRGWDNRVDLEYILARNSNYARVVYPAIAHAIKAGVISELEAQVGGWPST